MCVLIYSVRTFAVQSNPNAPAMPGIHTSSLSLPEDATTALPALSQTQIPLYLNLRAMERTPNAPHALIDTAYRLAELPVLLSIAVPQHLGFLPDALVLQVLNADAPCGAVDVVCDDDWVLARARADGEFDGWVARGEGGQGRLDEGVHAPARSPPVAVVEVEALALEDEGADAVLRVSVLGGEGLSCRGETVGLLTWAFATVRVAARGMLAVDGW